LDALEHAFMIDFGLKRRHIAAFTNINWATAR
jgi:superoxide dismutase